MKTINFSFTVIFILFCFVVSAQVQIDKQVQLTGTGTDGTITGIKQIPDSSSAVNAIGLQSGALVYAIATGSGNAYAITLTPPVSAYATGMLVQFKASFDNTGAATLSVNSLPGITLKKNYNVDLAASDIKSGQVVSVIYDGTNFQVLSQLPVSLSASCPSGFADATGFCIETNEHTATDWYSANAACISMGNRLCKWAEWHAACTLPLGLSNMTNDWEWTQEPRYDPNCDCVDQALKVGGGSCTADQVFNSYPREALSTTLTYRCCKDK